MMLYTNRFTLSLAATLEVLCISGKGNASPIWQRTIPRLPGAGPGISGWSAPPDSPARYPAHRGVQARVDVAGGSDEAASPAELPETSIPLVACIGRFAPRRRHPAFEPVARSKRGRFMTPLH